MLIQGYGKHANFDSNFSNDQAFNIVKGLDNSFAKSMTSKPLGSLSINQLYWIHKLAMDSIKPIQKIGYSYNIANTLILFDRVSTKLKFPKLRFNISEHDNFGNIFTSTMTLARMSERSRNPGAVAVTYNGIYKGYINRDGTSLTDFPQEIKQIIVDFEKDPLNYAKNSGHLAGRCMFCGLNLDDERSTKVGYGPICAKNWGLPWGN